MSEESIEKLESGVHGLDTLSDGGLIKNSTATIIGPSGSGKTTFLLQFLKEGLENGKKGLFISLQEKPKTLLKQAEMMGWDLKQYWKKSLWFIHLRGQNFPELIEEQLPQLIDMKLEEEEKKDLRIAIDPLTRVMWSTEDRIAREELISKFFEPLSEFGTVVSAVDNNSSMPGYMGEEVYVPLNLADTILITDYFPGAMEYKRTFQIFKMRGSAHSESIHPMFIVKKTGIVLGDFEHEEEDREYEKDFEEIIEEAKSGQVPDYMIDKMEDMKKTWIPIKSPKEMLKPVLEKY